MRGPPARRTVVALLGLAAASVAAAAFGLRDEISARLHRARLDRDPDYLLECARTAGEAPRRLALERFSATPAGKRGVFDAYLRHTVSGLRSCLPYLDPGTTTALLRVEPGSVDVDWPDGGCSVGTSICVSHGPPPPDPWPALAPLLAALEGGEFQLPEFPGLVFGFLPAPKARAEILGWNPAGEDGAGAASHLCVIRKEGPRGP